MAKPNLKLAATRDPARDALAAAIDDEAVARKNLDDAHAAAEKARGLVWAAEDRLAALREDAAQAQPAGAIITSLVAGVDLAELERPQVETRAKIDGAEQEVAAWRRAREAAEAEILPREEALEKAQRRVKRAVSEVVCTVDIDALLATAEQTQERLVAERARLLQLRASLPWASFEQRKIDAFLSQPILAHEHTDAWRDHPAVAPWRAAVDALHRDPDAPLPAIETESTVVILPANGRG